MATFNFNCPQCGNLLSAEEEWLGMETQCPTCNKNITISPNSSLAEDIKKTYDTDIEKHLNLAQLALKNAAFSEAHKEFSIVLKHNPEDITALYGEILSNAYISASQNAKLSDAIYAYQKAEYLLNQNNQPQHSLIDFRRKFIADFSVLVSREYCRIFSALNASKTAASDRAVLNMLNATRKGIFLGNQEAIYHKEQCAKLLPYMREIIAMRLFIISLINIDELINYPDILNSCKVLFESTLNLNSENNEIKNKYNQLLSAIYSTRYTNSANSVIDTTPFIQKIRKLNVSFVILLLISVLLFVCVLFPGIVILSCIGGDIPIQQRIGSQIPSVGIVMLLSGLAQSIILACWAFTIRKKSKMLTEQINTGKYDWLNLQNNRSLCTPWIKDSYAFVIIFTIFGIFSVFLPSIKYVSFGSFAWVLILTSIFFMLYKFVRRYLF